MLRKRYGIRIPVKSDQIPKGESPAACWLPRAHDLRVLERRLVRASRYTRGREMQLE